MRCGDEASSSFTFVTSPLTGENTSLADLTLSNAPTMPKMVDVAYFSFKLLSCNLSKFLRNNLSIYEYSI